MESSEVGRRAGQSRTQGRAEQCKQCGGQGSLCDTGTGQRRGRTELNVRRLISSAFYIHLFPLFNSAEKRVFLLGRSNRKSAGAAFQWRGAASQNETQSMCKNIPCFMDNIMLCGHLYMF